MINTLRNKTQYIQKRFLLLLFFILGVHFFGYGQTFHLVDENKIPNADGEPKWFYYGNNSIKVQATHELREIVYIANLLDNIQDSKTLKIQSKEKVSKYQRWFRYDTALPLPQGGLKFGSTVAAASYNNDYLGYHTNSTSYAKINYTCVNTTIAVDLSRQARTESSLNYTEPVLSYRMIFDIRDAAEIAEKLDNTDMNNPLESYDIIAPADKQLLIGPKYSYTSERSDFESNYYYHLNGVLKRASGYKDDNNGDDTFYWLHEDAAGQKTLIYPTLSGSAVSGNGNIKNHTVYNGRILAINGNDSYKDTTHKWYLLNNEGLCIARFTIKYQSRDEVGPQTPKLIGKDKETLMGKYKLLINRDFDFLDKNSSDNYYRAQALPWNESSYGFYSAYSTAANIPEWSEYGFFMNSDVLGGQWFQTGKTDRTYENTNKEGQERIKGRMYYIDAAETPGIISNLNISEACCPGTQIYISTWIHNLNLSNSSLGPNMNFEIVGINSLTNEEDIFCSYTTGTMAQNGTAEGSSWNQVFFSATVPRKDYHQMYFRIINNQLGTQGNDFAIDDIDIYMMKPAVEAKLTAPMCGNSAVVTLEIDYDKMIDIIGLNDATEDVALPIGCTIVDRIIYNRYLAGYDKNGEKVINPTEADALAEAQVKISTKASISGSADYFYFMLKHGTASDFFEKAYTEEPALTVGSVVTIDEYYDDFDKLIGKTTEKIFRKKNSTENKLVLQTQMIGTPEMPIAVGRDYYVIFNIIAPDFISSTDYSKYNNVKDSNEVYYLNPIEDIIYVNNKTTLTTASNYNTQGNCDVYTEYTLVGTISVEVDGAASLYYGGAEMCANTRPTFAVRSLTYIADGVEQEVTTENLGLTFDWFKGTVFDYQDKYYYITNLESSVYYDVKPDESEIKHTFTAKDALTKFRDLYFTAGSIADFSANASTGYYPAMRQLLIDLSKDNNETGFQDDNTLLLFKKSYNPLIKNDLGYMNNFLAIPIAKTINSDILVDNDKPISSVICLDAQPISITSSDLAPEMSIGEANVTYQIPIVPVRIGLTHIQDLCKNDTTTANRLNMPYLKIPINKAVFSNEDFDHMEDVIASSERYRHIILASTDDPDVIAKNQFGDFVGVIQWINVKRDASSNSSNIVQNVDNYINIYFYMDKDKDGNEFLPVKFREGYTYTLKFFISEYTTTGIKANTCEGSVFIPIKIVPEYQVWSPVDGNRNWNNDANWRRADASDFYGDSSYISNTDNYKGSVAGNINSFVPIYNTKVIIDSSDNKTASLIELTKNATTNVLDMKTNSSSIGEATNNIEFELSVLNKEEATDKDPFHYLTSSFYANRCQEIYFKSDAYILDPQHLVYEKAHVDFTIATKRWYLLGSPLNGVVAGDMYTLQSGLQNTHAFEDIHYNAATNNRFNPQVFQRGWDKVRATVIDFNGGSNDPAVQTQRPAAVKAAWSSVYNDVTVQYLSGLGYSIKSVPDITNDHSTTTFRLPKADTHYDYYTAGGASDSIDKTAVDTLRSGVGRLASDVLTTNQSLKIKLSDKSGGNNLGVNDEEGNKLYLLANPFMTYLNMQEFLRINTVFAPAYWLMTADKQAGVIMAESISSSSTDAATSIAPMQGFFVRLADGVNANPEIYYTAAMMTDPISEGTLTRANDGISQLYITATREGVSGTTTLRLVDEYANDNEQLNLPTLFDSNWEPYPMIYTIGDNKAMQIQTLKGVSTIPLGIYSNNEAEVEVKFENVESFSGLTLYDVVTETSTTIDRDMTVMLPGCTNGRYLLTFASNIEDDMMESITISSIERGSIWVTSDVNDVIKDIIVYDINGRVCKQLSSINHYSETIAIENGIYIVKVNTEQATTTAKVFVR